MTQCTNRNRRWIDRYGNSNTSWIEMSKQIFGKKPTRWPKMDFPYLRYQNLETKPWNQLAKCFLDCNFPSDWITMRQDIPQSIFILASLPLPSRKRVKVTRYHCTQWRHKTILSPYLKPINCSVELDCMLLVRSSSHHSGNDDWKFGKPSVSNETKEN